MVYFIYFAYMELLFIMMQLYFSETGYLYPFNLSMEIYRIIWPNFLSFLYILLQKFGATVLIIMFIEIKLERV